MKYSILFLLLLTINQYVVAQTQSISVQVSQSSDDAEESEDTSTTYIDSSDLELVFDDYSDQNNQTVGIRFQNVNIPANATITNAYIQFHVDETDDVATNLIIKGESSQNALTFAETAANISSRNTTTAQVNWDNIPEWAAVSDEGEAQRTPNLASIVSEIITSNNWEYGNAMVFILTGTGIRTAEAYDGEESGAPVLVVEYQIIQTVSVQVSQSSDDAEESEDTSTTYIDSSDLELVFDDYSDQNNQTVGIRFQNVNIPTNAMITNAYIQFHVDETDDVATNLIVKGESSQNAATFAETAANISSRNTTTAQVNWDNIPEWAAVSDEGEAQRTPNLASIVSEIITSNNWEYGNAMAFILTGTGTRTAEAYDGEESGAPKLVIEYTTPQDNIDLGISNLQGIEDYSYAQTGVEISVDVTNEGINEVNSFILSYSLDNGTPVVENVNQTIPSGETITYTFTQALDLTTIGNHTLKIEVAIDQDNVVYNNTLEKTFEVIEQYSNLYFGTDSAWKYLDDGSDLGTAWKDENFDDSNWNIGTGQFGFGDEDEDTPLSSGNITYYFRKKVQINDINTINTIVMNLLADDAAVVYVNGQEVIRSINLPEGAITSSTPATRTSTLTSTTFENTPVSYNLNSSFFNTGINTIAVEVHNASITNPDVSFSGEIVDQPIEYSIDGPYVFYKDNQIIVKKVTTNGPEITTYAQGSNPTLSCDLPNGDSFSFQLTQDTSIAEPTYDMPSKFIAFSDIEGRIESVAFFLQNAGVIDENYNWTYGDGHLYLLGDVFDRGDYQTQTIWLLYKLEQEAKLAGGDVHTIVGNHEIINFKYDYRYLHPKYFHNAHYVGEMLEDMYEPNTELGRWFRTKNIIENAGNSAVFMHGGISPDVNNLNLTYQQINDYGRLGMDNNCPDDDTNCNTVNGGTSQGIYWYRGMANQDLSQIEVDDILMNFNAEKAILGHTIKFDKITPIYDDKILLINLDHKNNYEVNGYMEGLYYQNGCYYRFIAEEGNNRYVALDSECDNLLTENVSENLENELEVTPNPFSNNLTINYSNVIAGQSVFIYDIAGRLVNQFKLPVNQNIYTIDTRALRAGVYVIKVKSDKGVITKKIIRK